MASMRTIGVRLKLWIDEYKREAADARRATQDIGEQGKKTRRDLDGLAMGLGIVGGALVGLATVAVVATAKFDKQMSEVGAVANATGDELMQLREAALEAGAATSFSASQAAQAEAELAKAGVVTADILGGALTGALDLAAAGTLELETAATIAANAMNTFSLKGQDVGRIADVLAAAANKSAAGVEDLGLGLQQVGLVADQVGFSLEETVGLLAAFADRGLRGSDGATSLKTALLRLAAPIGDAADLMKELGISLYDSNGQMVGAVEIARQLEQGLGDMSAAERNAALNTIFGADAIRAANVLYGLGEDGIRDYINAVDDEGAAADVAAAKLDNLAGDVEELTGSLETLFIQSGSGVTGPLRGFAQWATNMVNQFGALPPAVQGTGVAVVGLTGLTLLGAAAFIKMRSGVLNTVEQLHAMGPAGRVAGTAVSRIASGAAKTAGVLGALTLAAGAIGQIFGDDLNPQMDAAGEGLERWVKTGESAGEFARLFGEDLSRLDRDLDMLNDAGIGAAKWIEGFLQLGRFSDSYSQAAERIGVLDQALADLVRSGDMQTAARGFELIRDRAIAQGTSMEEVKKLFPEYAAALEVIGAEAAEVDPAIEELARHNIALGGAFGEAANEADGLKNAFDELNGAMLTLRGSQRDAEQAVDDLTEALEESNGSLDITTEEGRNAAAAVDSLAEAAIDAAQATYDQTGSVEQANAVYQNYIEQLRLILLNAGYAEDEVNALIGQIAAMPTYRAVDIEVRQRFTLANQPYRPYGGGFFERWGGVVAAATGRLQATTVTSPTVLFGERETEEEAFIPKRGDYSRSIGILQKAAGWMNADVVPRGGWSSGAMAGGEIVLRVEPAPGADQKLMGAVIEGLRFTTSKQGAGSVQTWTGQRGPYGG